MTSDPISSGADAPTPRTTPAPVTAGLVRRAAAGDAVSFERLVRLYERRVHAVARRLLGDGGEAEDAVQEAFLRLYRAMDRVDPDRPLTPYLDRITVNVCRDLGRRRSRRRELPLEGAVSGRGEPSHDPDSGPGPANPEDVRPGPAEDAALAQVRRLAAAALRELPFKQRAALVLREFHGLSTREVAHALGSSETSIRSHVCRARLTLRERLAALRGTSSATEEVR